MVCNPVFIVSTGRTGTMALARACRAANPECWATHEPGMPRITRMLGSLYQRGVVPASVPQVLIRWSREDVLRGPACPYVEANPMLARLVSPLADVFPSLTLVHVVRDPVAYVQSVERFGTFRGWKGWAMRMVPALLPEVYRVDYRRSFGVDTPVVRAASYWSSLNELIVSDAHRLGLDYRRLRYEDIFAGEPAAIDMLSALCEARPEDLRARLLGPRVNASKEPSSTRWSLREREIVANLCGPLAAEYGYGPLGNARIAAGGGPRNR